MKDCAIVCGYPTDEDGKISNILKSRIDKAIELYQERKIRYIIVSGGSVHNTYNEALAMKHYALTKNINEEFILVEGQAKSTYHNMKYSKDIMEKYHLKTCYVVTNSWHKIKAEYYAQKFHLDYQMINANQPEGMSFVKVLLLTFYMPVNMFINRLKGYK